MPRYFNGPRFEPSASMLAMESELAVLRLELGYIDTDGMPTNTNQDGTRNHASAATKDAYRNLMQRYLAVAKIERRAQGF